MSIPKDLMELDKFKLMVSLLNPYTDLEIDKKVEKMHDDVWIGKLMILERREHGKR